jgi:hypothetical protein
MALDFGDTPRRVSALLACYRSEPGREPVEPPHRLDPATQALRLLRSPAAAPAGAPPAPAAAAPPARS